MSSWTALTWYMGMKTSFYTKLIKSKYVRIMNLYVHNIIRLTTYPHRAKNVAVFAKKKQSHTKLDIFYLPFMNLGNVRSNVNTSIRNTIRPNTQSKINNSSHLFRVKHAIHAH